jgi:hypothetical protein
VIVYCRLADWQEMFIRQSRETKPHKPDGHARDVKAHYEDIVKRYDALMDELSDDLTVLRYSWQDDDINEIVTRIRKA